mgnify:CR=1 FL=1
MGNDRRLIKIRSIEKNQSAQKRKGGRKNVDLSWETSNDKGIKRVKKTRISWKKQVESC